MTDVNAVFWNPACITGLRGREAAFNYAKWFGGLHVASGALGIRAGGFGVFAVDFITLDYGDLHEALVTSPTGGLDTRTGNTFGGNDLSLGLSFSRQYTDKLSIGIRGKYLREELFTFSCSLWAWDVGSLYDTGWRGIRLAMSAQNFSRQARWLRTREEAQQKFELPLLFRIGCSIDLLGGENLFLGGDRSMQRLTVDVDALHSNDYAERLHVGLEFCLFDRFAVRGGYRLNYEEGNLSAGFGFQHRLPGLSLRIDYAYTSYDFLDSPHRLSVLLAF
jgi:hypothetical protein